VHHSVAWNDLAEVERLFDGLEGQVAAVCVAAAYANMALPVKRGLLGDNGKVRQNGFAPGE
jgi:glutamate-1-semialdehyde aminotransferase